MRIKWKIFIKGFDREDITKAKRDTEIEYTVCLILFVQLIVLFNLYIYRKAFTINQIGEIIEY